MTTVIRTGTRKITVDARGIQIADTWGYTAGGANLTAAQRDEIVAALNAEIKAPDLFDKFKDLAVGDQFTLLSDANAARGTKPSKAVKVDADTYFSYKKNKLNNAASVLAGKPGTITKN